MNNYLLFKLHSLAHISELGDLLLIFLAQIFGLIFVFLLLFLLAIHKDGTFNIKIPFKNFKEKAKELFIIFFPSFFSWVFATIMQKIIKSPRPFLLFEEIKPLFIHGGLDSFPSGHSMVFATLATSLFFVNKKIGILFAGISLIVGLSRVACGVHFPIDVIAGYIGGIIVGFFFNYLFNKFKKETTK